jgi:CO/xanthine dehydrogenase FAD-binding subunit
MIRSAWSTGSGEVLLRRRVTTCSWAPLLGGAVGDARSAYVRARDLDHALTALAAGSLVPLAGGTDVYPARVGRDAHPAVLDLGDLDELRGLETSAAGLRIGALTTWSELVAAELPPGLRALVQAAREVCAIQVQNAGTIAGNLVNASPAADGIPPLLVLDAQVELASTNGTRTLPLTDFLTGYRATERRPDELVTAVIVPAAGLDHASAFVKLGSRRYLVISIVMVAVALQVREGRIEDPRVSVGACSPVALRLRDVEAALVGATPDEVSGRVAEAGVELAPIDDVRGSAGYRRTVASRLVVRGVHDAFEAAGRTEVPA